VPFPGQVWQPAPRFETASRPIRVTDSGARRQSGMGPDTRLPIIFITATKDADSAIEAMKQGAFDLPAQAARPAPVAARGRRGAGGGSASGRFRFIPWSTTRWGGAKRNSQKHVRFLLDEWSGPGPGNFVRRREGRVLRLGRNSIARRVCRSERCALRSDRPNCVGPTRARYRPAIRDCFAFTSIVRMRSSSRDGADHRDERTNSNHQTSFVLVLPHFGT
jgi:hypothetical protein